MSVKIRLARIGKKHAPYYRIASLEILGTYNPLKGELVQFHNDRIEYWISKGAIPTDAVSKLQKMYQQKGIVA